MAASDVKLKLVARVKYESNGTVKTGTVTLGPTGRVNTATENTMKSIVQNYQKITTDTVIGFYTEETTYYDTVAFGTPGTVEAGWADYSNVKLVNSYTDGSTSYTETIKRPATGATEDQLVAYAGSIANITEISADDEGSVNAVSGYFTGSTVETAWQNS